MDSDPSFVLSGVGRQGTLPTLHIQCSIYMYMYMYMYVHVRTSRAHNKTGEEEERVTSADFGAGQNNPPVLFIERSFARELLIAWHDAFVSACTCTYVRVQVLAGAQAF